MPNLLFSWQSNKIHPARNCQQQEQIFLYKRYKRNFSILSLFIPGRKIEYSEKHPILKDVLDSSFVKSFQDSGLKNHCGNWCLYYARLLPEQQNSFTFQGPLLSCCGCTLMTSALILYLYIWEKLVWSFMLPHHNNWSFTTTGWLGI